MEKFNVGLFVQESRSIDIEAESQEDAEQKVKDMLSEMGTDAEGAIQLYKAEDTELEIREIEVFADKDLIIFDAPEDLYMPPDYIEELKESDIPLLEEKEKEVK